MTALEDERAQAGSRQVGAVHQTVVASAEDDGVVVPIGRHGQAVFLAGLNSGARATVQATFW